MDISLKCYFLSGVPRKRFFFSNLMMCRQGG